MADSSYIESMFGGLAADTKRALVSAFDYLLDNLRLGPFETGTRSRNFQWYWLSATTSSVAGQEFSVAHGLGRTPYLAMQVAPLNAVNSQIVSLQVTRAADISRIYLSSPSTSAAIALLVE
jgi:hypothetical protein